MDTHREKSLYIPDQTEVCRPNFFSFNLRACIGTKHPFRPPNEHFFLLQNLYHCTCANEKGGGVVKWLPIGSSLAVSICHFICFCARLQWRLVY